MFLPGTKAMSTTSPKAKRGLVADGVGTASKILRARLVVPAAVRTSACVVRSPTYTTGNTLLSKRGGPSGDTDTDVTNTRESRIEIDVSWLGVVLTVAGPVPFLRNPESSAVSTIGIDGVRSDT